MVSNWAPWQHPPCSAGKRESRQDLSRRPARGARAVNEAILSMVAAGEIGALDPVDSYLMHRFWADLSDRYWAEPPGDDATTTADDDNDEDDDARGDGHARLFSLQHPDDKGDHILVNAAHDIVGLIDWEGVRPGRGGGGGGPGVGRVAGAGVGAVPGGRGVAGFASGG